MVADLRLLCGPINGWGAGIEAVVGALRKHADNSQVVEQACGALVNLAYNNEDNSKAIAVAGGIEAVAGALRVAERSHKL